MDMIRDMNNPQSVRNRQLVITDEELLTGRRELPLEMAGGEGDTHVRLGQKKKQNPKIQPNITHEIENCHIGFIQLVVLFLK